MKKHKGIALIIIGLVFGLVESIYFGYGTIRGINIIPESVTEYTFDIISFLLIAAGTYITCFTYSDDTLKNRYVKTDSHKTINLEIMTKDMYMLRYMTSTRNKEYLESTWDRISKGNKFILYNPKENGVYSVNYINRLLTYDNALERINEGENCNE